MRYSFTLLYFLFIFSIRSFAQDMTGIWKGYFVQNVFGFAEDRYKFEVQVEQLKNNALSGVTYSYKTTVFYGKAEAKGIYTKKTNNILLNEIKLVDVKIDSQSQPCLMTCYLEYNKMGDIETLTGTYSSRNLKSGTDCGSGKVYLEKSTVTDFYKEDFLVKRENELRKRDKKSGRKAHLKPGAEGNLIAESNPSDKPTAKSANPAVKPAKPIAKQDKPAAKIAARKKSVTKPKAAETPAVKSDQKIIPPPQTVNEPKKQDTVAAPPPPVVKVLPKPEILKTRDNDLVKTITTSAKEFKIELYDNGEIDGDRISVYHNNELIVSNKTLTDKPISFTIKADEGSPVHEFVMVAENLGSIPPNTALMILTAGEKRYELFITSTEKKNAVVRIEYKK
jgi:hypothetical protein